MATSESLRLQQQLRQQQTLAPMQLQYVKMLEMNTPEVEDEVQRALDENPALEADDAEPVTPVTDNLPYYRTSASNHSADDSYVEPIATAESESLIESLMHQLSQDSDLSDRDMEIAHFIIGNIDPNGYLTRPLRSISDDLAITAGIEVSDEDIKRVWRTVRALDPAGVGATDLRDSLMLQLQRLSPSPQVDTATRIVRDYFDLFSLMHYTRLQSMLGISEEELREAIAVIRTLNPKPGAQISGGMADSANQITPDFMVEAEGDRLNLTLLNSIPRLRIAASFAADTPVEKRRSPGSEQANAFIRQRRDEASGFIRALEMRQATLFRVMSAIMQWQREFFLTEDPATLRPMILKDISDATGDDISVISRAAAGKYVATNHGVYPLRFFFNEARDGDDASSHTVIARLREIIDNEDKSAPLTDDALTKILASEGINIARRTVAKYRERMGIPVGRLRKIF